MCHRHSLQLWPKPARSEVKTSSSQREALCQHDNHIHDWPASSTLISSSSQCLQLAVASVGVFRSNTAQSVYPLIPPASLSRQRVWLALESKENVDRSKPPRLLELGKKNEEDFRIEIWVMWLQWKHKMYRCHNTLTDEKCSLFGQWKIHCTRSCTSFFQK